MVRTINIAWMLFVFCVLQSLGLRTTLAQQSTPPQANRSNDSDRMAAPVQVIRLEQLGDPPAVIAELIQRGQVRLITGGEPHTNPQTLSPTGRLAGETRFTLRYRYDSHANWKIHAAAASHASREKQVQIRVHFRFIKLITTHDVWLRNPPGADRFWDNSIVRHEFDHVKISSDPRIEMRFRDAVKKIKLMRVPLSKVVGAGGRIENTKVQALIESRMKQALKQVTDYVGIRYRELDRLTQHGRRPLPEGC